jgi:hypothetical protein
MEAVVRMDGHDRAPPEHREAIQQIVAELRATAAFQAVEAARTPGAGRIPDEVLAMLLLALPPPALAALPATTSAALAPLRRFSGDALGREITALRDQMTVLCEWRCRG